MEQIAVICKCYTIPHKHLYYFKGDRVRQQCNFSWYIPIFRRRTGKVVFFIRSCWTTWQRRTRIKRKIGKFSPFSCFIIIIITQWCDTYKHSHTQKKGKKWFLSPPHKRNPFNGSLFNVENQYCKIYYIIICSNIIISTCFLSLSGITCIHHPFSSTQQHSIAFFLFILFLRNLLLSPNRQHQLAYKFKWNK